MKIIFDLCSTIGNVFGNMRKKEKREGRSVGKTHMETSEGIERRFYQIGRRKEGHKGQSSNGS